MSRVLDSRRLAEYRRRVSDPAYLARALTHVAGLLSDSLLPPGTPQVRVLARERDSIGDSRMYN